MEVHEAWEQIRNKSSEWWDQLQKKFSPYIDKLDEWTTPPTLSLRIEDEKITLLHLEKRGESIRVISLKAIPKESDLIDISEFPESAICVSGISAARCLVRTLELRGIKANEIGDAFRFQAETLIPYPPEEALFGKILLHSEGDHHELAMIATKAADVEESSEGFILKGIKPQYITSDVVAFACFVKTIIPSDSTIAFYLSRDNSFGIALSNGKLLASYPFSLTGPDDEEFNHEESQKALLQPLLALEKYLPNRAKTSEILICGPLSANRDWKNSCLQAMNRSERKWDFNQLKGLSKEEQQTQALSIGLALAPLSTDLHVDYLEQETIPSYQWKRLLIPIASTVVASILFSLLLFMGFSISRSGELNQARETYARLLLLFDKGFSSSKKSLTNEGNLVSTPQSVEKMRISELEEGADRIRKEMNAISFNFPLLPLVPKVSDFLEWLCTLPSSVEMANGKKRALIQVENFAYQFVKAPDKNRPREHYQVKVDLTFTAQESMHAREFHSALLEPNQFIDPRSEVKWSFSEGKYRTSFFLKDLTTYY